MVRGDHMTGETPLESPADEIERLRRCVSDLVSIMALPALWADAEPSHIVSSVLDALLRMLRLDFVFARLTDLEDGTPMEAVRVAQWLEGTPIADVDLSIGSARLGVQGELGSVIAGSQRRDFPVHTERLLLDVAANHAAIRLQQARLARHGRAEEALRERERESRLIVETIPGLVAILTPRGEVDVVNQQLVEFCGQPLEAMRQWGTNGTVHFDDLPHVGPVFSQAIAAGEPYDFEARIRRFDGIYRWCQVAGLPLRDTAGRIARWYVLLTDIDDRKRSEDALRERERESRLIVDSIPGLVATSTPTGDLEGVNKQVLEYCGRTLEELKDWATSNLVHPEDLPRVSEIVARSVASGDPYEFEERIRRFDGVYRWFQVRGLPLRDSNDRIVRWYALLTDIDERKRAEEALRQSERQFRLLVETIPALVWRGTPEGELDYLNERAVEFLGHTADSLTGERWLELIHPDHRDSTVRRWLQSVTTGASYEDIYRIRRADGQYRWIRSLGEPLRDTQGRIAHWYGLVVDVEARMRTENELRRSEAFLAEGQRLSATGTFSWHPDTNEITWSEQVYRIFELEPGSRVTLEIIASRVHPDDMPLLHDMVERAQRGVDFEYEHRIRMPDGSVKHLHMLAHGNRDEQGRQEYFGAVQDVTQRRLADEALDTLRSELTRMTRVMSLGALTASIAHEVNQPLSGIITNANTCLRMLDADPPNVEGARETARRTIRDGSRAADVVARLRALFSKREFTLESMDLNEATREVIALSLTDLQRNRVVLQSELANDLPRITGDRVQLQQVILNLLRNASDAMVNVADRPRELLVRTERDTGDCVRVSVRDAGVGVDRQNIDKLFDPFYTTKSGGMGVGLSVSRSIVERHHGRLWAEPNDGPGATFSFSIPRDPESRERGGDVLRTA